MEDIPVPIPNTEVKLHSAESSWGIAPCEGRTLPCKLLRQPLWLAFFYVKKYFWHNEQKPLFLLFLYESYVITKNYESRKKFRFLLELDEMPSNAIGLRITFIN